MDKLSFKDQTPSQNEIKSNYHFTVLTPEERRNLADNIITESDWDNVHKNLEEEELKQSYALSVEEYNRENNKPESTRSESYKNTVDVRNLNQKYRITDNSDYSMKFVELTKEDDLVTKISTETEKQLGLTPINQNETDNSRDFRIRYKITELINSICLVFENLNTLLFILDKLQTTHSSDESITEITNFLRSTTQADIIKNTYNIYTAISSYSNNLLNQYRLFSYNGSNGPRFDTVLGNFLESLRRIQRIRTYNLNESIENEEIYRGNRYLQVKALEAVQSAVTMKNVELSDENSVLNYKLIYS